MRRTVDERGVDLLAASLTVATPSVSIGQPGFGGLEYYRVWDSAVQAWRDNVTGTIQLNTGVTPNEYVVSLFGASEKFTLSGGVYTPKEVTGSTLTFNAGTNKYTYTLADGSVAVFDKALASSQPTQASEGRITTFTAPSGETTTFTYKALSAGSWLAHRLQSVTNNLGYQLKLTYQTNNADDTGLTVTSVKAINNAVEYCDPAVDSCTLTGSWPTLTFATSGATQTVTDSLSRATTFTFTSGALTGIRRPTSGGADNWTVVYSGGLVQTMSNGTGTWTYGFTDSAGLRFGTVTDPLSHSRVITMDLASGQVVSDRDGANRTVSYLYNAASRLLERITAPEGNYTTFSHDSRGNITKTTSAAKPGSGLADITTSAVYPLDSACTTNRITCNLPTSTIDERGFQTDYTWDSTHGGLLTATMPAPSGAAPTGSGTHPETRITYSNFTAWTKDGTGAITPQSLSVYRPTAVSSCATASACSGGADETKTTLSYTAGSSSTASNVLPASTSVGAGDGSLTATTSVVFDSIGNLFTVDGPLSGTSDTTRYRFDAVRQLVGVVGPDPDGGGALKNRAVRTTYNADGQATLVEQGAVLSQSDPDWANFATLQQQVLVYDFIGRLTKQSLTAGGTTFAVSQFSYDAADRLDCAAARMNPSVFGSLPSSACSLGTTGSYGADRIVKYGYSAADEVTSVQSGYGTALAQTTAAATFTDNGLEATLTDAGGNKTTFEYDGFDRPLKIRFPSPTTPGTSSTTDYEQFGYDAGSNLTSDRRRDATSIAFTYDNLSRRAAMDLPGGTAGDVSYAYDNFGRLTSAAIAGNTLSFAYDQLSRVTGQTNPRGTTGYQYDLAGRRTRLTHPDGLYVNYDWDLADEATAVRVNGASSGVGVVANFAYDDLGRRTALARGNGTSTAYGYDGASRLTGLSHDLAGTGADIAWTFGYNPAGQIVSRTASNAAYNGPAPANGTTGYARNGLNQYTAVGAATPTYDARGNITYDGQRTYGFDALNRLISASGAGTMSWDPVSRPAGIVAGTTVVNLNYDGDDLIDEYLTGGMLRRHIFAPGVDEPLLTYEGADTANPSWLYADPLGSVVGYANASGTSTAATGFDEFGLNNYVGGRFQFTGQAWFPGAIGSDLYHYEARAYSSTLGRFLQSDPILYAGGMNLYAYVGNDPVNLRDPWGLQVDGGGDTIRVGGSRVVHSVAGISFAFHLGSLTFRGTRADAFGSIQRDCGQDSVCVVGQRPSQSPTLVTLPNLAVGSVSVFAINGPNCGVRIAAGVLLLGGATLVAAGTATPTLAALAVAGGIGAVGGFATGLILESTDNRAGIRGSVVAIDTLAGLGTGLFAPAGPLAGGLAGVGFASIASVTECLG